MGMFTRIIVEIDGKEDEIQIKTGNDQLDIYKVGDKVDWKIDKNWYREGTLLDGVYEGTGGNHRDGYKDYYVVIKDHIVKEFVEIEKDKDGYPINENLYDELYKKYNIQELDDSNWTQESKEKYLKRQEDYEREFEEWKKKVNFDNLSEEQQIGLLITRPIMHKLNYVGIASQIMEVKPLKLK